MRNKIHENAVVEFIGIEKIGNSKLRAVFERKVKCDHLPSLFSLTEKQLIKRIAVAEKQGDTLPESEAALTQIRKLTP